MESRCWAFWTPSAAAQTGANVRVIANRHSQASHEVAEHHARRRSVPTEQILRLNLPATEEISRAVYESQIEPPLKEWLMVQATQDRILYFVLTKDVPLRITGTGGMTGTVASVDSELTLLYRKLWGNVFPASGSVNNPYFLGDSPPAETKPFTHRSHDLYLVARLDGYNVADVQALIDRCAEPSQKGLILLDGRLEFGQSVVRGRAAEG